MNKPPITILKELQDILNAPYNSFHSKQKDLSDFIEHDLDKVILALEQQERDHEERIDNLKEEVSALEDEIELGSNYINQLDGAYV